MTTAGKNALFFSFAFAGFSLLLTGDPDLINAMVFGTGAFIGGALLG